MLFSAFQPIGHRSKYIETYLFTFNYWDEIKYNSIRPWSWYWGVPE